MTRPRVAAHRGGAALWPENSLRAFRAALDLGADLLELDVHLAADGEVVVVHDPTLDRTTDATGPVAARTSAALRAVRLRGPDGAVTDERVPTLAEVLALLADRDAGLLLEIKGPRPGVAVTWERRGGRAVPVGRDRYEGLEDAVLERLEKAGLGARTTVMAFNPAVLEHVRRRAPRQRPALLVAGGHLASLDAPAADAVAVAAALGAQDLGVHWSLADEALVRDARAAGLALGVWTVNDEPTLRRMADLGVDVLTTDRPDLALTVMGRRR